MMMVMLPFFLLAMYEKNGQPLEVILKQMIETKFIRPKNRPYQTNNFYESLARQRDLEMEVKRIVQNRKYGGKSKAHRQRKKRPWIRLSGRLRGMENPTPPGHYPF